MLKGLRTDGSPLLLGDGDLLCGGDKLMAMLGHVGPVGELGAVLSYSAELRG